MYILYKKGILYKRIPFSYRPFGPDLIDIPYAFPYNQLHRELK